MVNDRLRRQIEFIAEIDKLKQVYRQSIITDGSRQENDAEHSWHLAMMAVLLAEYVDGQQPVDVLRVVKMLLAHDIVEIDAGDTYCYDAEAGMDKMERERRAANRIFGLLPDDQAQELKSLWEEFEAGATVDARFAAALDRIQPLLLQYYTGGKSWQLHGITSRQVVARNSRIKDISEELGRFVDDLLQECLVKKYLPG